MKTTKEVIKEVETQLQFKIDVVQNGIPTFFDNVFKVALMNLRKNDLYYPIDYGPKGLTNTNWINQYIEDLYRNRYVSYESRCNQDTIRKNDISEETFFMSQGTERCLLWKDQPLFKTVFDFAIIPMLIHELKPASIFEIGSGLGTSARWMADIVQNFNLDSKVYSVDIQPVNQSYHGVQFFEGNCEVPTSLFNDVLISAPKPWLVLEDAHINVDGVLMHFDKFIKEGDYVYVEDSRDKTRELNLFIQNSINNYLVDTYYTDYFGYNATCATNSIFVAR